MAVLGGITDGLIANVLFAPVSRAVSVSFQKYLRLNKLKAKIDEDPGSLPPAIKTALNDIRTYLGSWKGEYSDQTDLLLEHLQSSSVLTAIVEAKLSDNDTGPLVRKYLQDAEKILPQAAEETHLNFISHVSDFLHQSVVFQIEDQAAQQYIDANFKTIRRKIDALTVALESKGVISNITPQAIKKNKEKITSSLKLYYQDLHIQTIRGPITEKIDDMYIGPRIISDVESTDVRQFNLAKQLAKNTDHSVLSIHEFASSFHRAVILGDPGGGKTTLAQFICWSFCAGTNFTQHLLPLRVTLKVFDTMRQRTPQISLLDFIAGEVSRICNGLDKGSIVDTIRDLLNRGEVLVVFDGLDEISDISSRKSFVKLASTFSNEFPLCPVLATCRIKDYADAPLPSEFETFTLHPFDEKEVKNYALRYFGSTHRANKSEKEIDKIADDFLRKTSGHSEEVRDNPLMLSLMCGLYEEYKGRIPQHTYRIYEECSILVFKRWDEEREEGSIPTRLPEKEELFSILSHIAEKMYVDPKLQSGVSPKWLLTTLESYFVDDGLDKRRANELAKTIRSAITGRSWVMVDVGANTYDFTHRSFLEYFYSRHLADEFPSLDELMDESVQLVLSKPNARMPCHLALQAAASTGKKQVSRAETAILEHVSQPAGPSSLSEFTFISETFSYLPFSDMRLPEIISGICNTFLNWTEEVTIRNDGGKEEIPLREARASISNMLSCHPDRLQSVVKNLDNYFANTVTINGTLCRRVFLLLSDDNNSLHLPSSFKERDFYKRVLVETASSNASSQVILRSMFGVEINEPEFEAGWRKLFLTDKWHGRFDKIFCDITDRYGDGRLQKQDAQLIAALYKVLGEKRIRIDASQDKVMGTRVVKLTSIDKALRNRRRDNTAQILLSLLPVYFEFASIHGGGSYVDPISMWIFNDIEEEEEENRPTIFIDEKAVIHKLKETMVTLPNGVSMKIGDRKRKRNATLVFVDLQKAEEIRESA